MGYFESEPRHQILNGSGNNGGELSIMRIVQLACATVAALALTGAVSAQPNCNNGNYRYNYNNANYYNPNAGNYVYTNGYAQGYANGYNNANNCNNNRNTSWNNNWNNGWNNNNGGWNNGNYYYGNNNGRRHHRNNNNYRCR